MNDRLILKIQEESENYSSIEEVLDVENLLVSKKLKVDFNLNEECAWWWEKIKSKENTIFYGDKCMLNAINNIFSNDMVFLVVTDDGPPPWRMFKGRLKDFTTVIGEIYSFEFHLFNKNFSWLMFDNHHNELVFKGDGDVLLGLKKEVDLL